MFKNRLDAAKQLAEKINHDNVQPNKIIGLSENGKKSPNT
jgi:predicted phosphoribosyltransferase